MKALMIEKPGKAIVVDRPEPIAGHGEVLVRVARAGLCGTGPIAGASAKSIARSSLVWNASHFGRFLPFGSPVVL